MNRHRRKRLKMAVRMLLRGDGVVYDHRWPYEDRVKLFATLGTLRVRYEGWGALSADGEHVSMLRGRR